MQMSWQEFEQLIGAYFVRLGYVATLTEGSADGGIDLILNRWSKRILCSANNGEQPEYQ